MPPEVLDDETEESDDVPAMEEALAPEGEASTEEQAAFDAGFDKPEEATEETSPPAEESEPTPAAPAPEPEPETVTLTKADHDKLMAVVNEFPTLKTAVDRNFGKLGGIERTMSTIQARTPVGHSLKLTEEDFPQQMREDFPDLVRDQIAAFNKAAERAGVTGTAAPSVDPAQFEQQLSEREQRMTLRLMDTVRPGWRKVVNSPEYTAWVKAQPADFQAKHDATWEPNDILEAIESFESAKPKPSTKPAAARPSTPPANPAPVTRSRRLATAVAPKGGGTAASAALSEEQLFNQGYKTGRV